MTLNYIGHNNWDGQNFINFYNNVISKRWDRIILFCQNEYDWHSHNETYFPLLLEHCIRTNQVIDVIAGSHSDQYPTIPNIITDNTRVVYWGTNWLGKTYHSLIRVGTAKSINPYQTTDYKYHFISMNSNPHQHRQYLVDLLAKYDLLRFNAVSMHQQNSNVYTWKYFKFEPLILEPEFPSDKQQHRVPDQYYNSFAQLVSESADDTIFLSEKTATPLILGKPFVVATQKNFHKYLKELGFQLYDEIFDYSFDTITDREERFEALLQNFIRLQKIPLGELSNLQVTIADKIEYNKKRAKEIIYDPNYYPTLAQEIIDCYLKTGVSIDQKLISDYQFLQEVRNLPL